MILPKIVNVRVMPISLNKARHGYFNKGHALITSTNKAANRPKWLPEGPDSAR